jgi:phospholipase C
MNMGARITPVLAVIALVACGRGSTPPAPPSPGPPSVSSSIHGKVQHIVIIIQENRSVDNLFQGLPGADTVVTGLDSTGKSVALRSVRLSAPYDLDHSHRGFKTEYNDGAMNGFNKVLTTCSSAPCSATAYGYVPHAESRPYFEMAEHFTFADRMFQTNEGPSLPAHLYLLTGTSVVADGSDLYDAENPRYVGDDMDCGGSAKSTVELININTGVENMKMSPPCFDPAPTPFDELTARDISYKYYTSKTAGVWAAPAAIKHIWNNPNLWAHVVTPNTMILTDISNKSLPAVSWVIPTALASDHAGLTDGTGPSWVASVVNAIGKSQYWSTTTIFVTWDDWGGWYDHVAPQRFNAYELGFRVPLIVISPYAKTGYVSHVPHEFGSIIHFIEEKFGLPALGFTDVRADDLSDCFDFSQPATPFVAIRAPYNAQYFLRLPPSNKPIDTDW